MAEGERHADVDRGQRMGDGGGCAVAQVEHGDREEEWTSAAARSRRRPGV
jgi:hypothetical protein